jgi:prophage antirepressor-like protein
MLSVFKNDMFQLTVYGSYEIPLFKAQEVGQLIDYKCVRSVLRKMPTEFLDVRRTHTIRGLQETTFLTESGLYYLVLRSNKPQAIQFQAWVCNEVLPSIRKTGEYSLTKNVHQKLCFKMENEYDLHTKTIDFIRHRYPTALINASLGENQDTSNKRIKSFCQGYEAGMPDIILLNLHKKYTGLVIEFKSPTGQGVLSEKQERVLKNLELNNYRVIVSNNYDDIIFELITYMSETRVQCPNCSRKFKSVQSLGHHTRGFHRII